ncbi:hypothetical protein VZT92_009045 [Zoarces viviparus]|uniref:Ig-like domain-containing protein n=1 Tax=Zoarces viviparus TaxID=48416 RepID=A0AAW1FGT6_ZOAVI
MSPALFTFGFLVLVLTRQVESVSIEQSSSQIVKIWSEKVTINCRHDDNSLSVMMWYQHRQSSRSMSLIGYMVEQSPPSYEEQFKETLFRIRREDTLRGSLLIHIVNLTDSAVYFCAASTQ